MSNLQIKTKKWFQSGNIDTGFLLIVLILLTVGVVMMFSASYVSASFSAKTNYNPYYYFKRQALFAVAGIAAMFVVSRVHVTVFKRFAPIIGLVCFALLVLVLIFPAVIPGKEEFRRWLHIPGLPEFQPSELAKFGLIVYCARLLSERVKKPRAALNEPDRSIPLCFALILVTCVLVYAENHLSCTILMLGIGAVMLVLGGVRKRWIVLVLGAAIFGLMIFLAFHDSIIEKLPIGAYAKSRLSAWVNKDYSDRGTRWQTNQSLYAIGSGGLFGVGLGNSKQKHLYMPEPQNDFIFAIVCEEIGFVGAVLVLLLFALLIWRGFVIAMRNKDRFSALLVMGVMAQVGLQTILNILVVTDTIPNTGISLPFFSYGGSSLLVLLAETGVVLSVSRASNLEKQ